MPKFKHGITISEYITSMPDRGMATNISYSLAYKNHSISFGPSFGASRAYPYPWNKVKNSNEINYKTKSRGFFGIYSYLLNPQKKKINIFLTLEVESDNYKAIYNFNDTVQTFKNRALSTWLGLNVRHNLSEHLNINICLGNGIFIQNNKLFIEPDFNYYNISEHYEYWYSILLKIGIGYNF